MSKQISIEKAFGKVLRETRDKAEMSQEELALTAGLDRSFISLLERGLRQPSLTTVFVLAAVLNTDPSKMVASVAKIATKQVNK